MTAIPNSPISVPSQITQLKEESNTLKQIALHEGEEICEMINKRLGELENAYKGWRPSRVLGRISKPLIEGSFIRTNRSILNEIVVLRRDLTQAENVTQIEKLSEKILSKLRKLNQIHSTESNDEQLYLFSVGVNTHVSKLAIKIEEVKKKYTSELTASLQELGQRIDKINKTLTSPASIDQQAIRVPVTTTKKIADLNKSILKIARSYSSSDLQPLANIDQELAKIEDIQHIVSNRAADQEKATENERILREKITGAKLPSASTNRLLDQINAIKKDIQASKREFPMDFVTHKNRNKILKQAKKLADINIALKKLDDETGFVIKEYKAAAAAFIKVPDKEKSNQELQTHVDLLGEMERNENGRFGVGIAKTNLINLKKKLDTRHTAIMKTIDKDMLKAKTASDFKEIKERLEQLSTDYETTKNIGSRLVNAVKTNLTEFNTKQGSSFGINHDDLPETQAAKNKLMALFDKHAALLKADAKKDLNAYISSLEKMTDDTVNIGDKFETLIVFETGFQNELQGLSEKLKTLKTQMGEKVKENKYVLESMQEIISMMKTAKTALDKDVKNFSWENHVNKTAIIKEGIEHFRKLVEYIESEPKVDFPHYDNWLRDMRIMDLV